MVQADDTATEADDAMQEQGRAGLSPWLMGGAALALVAIALLGWLGWRWRASSRVGDLVRSVQVAIDAGDLGAAETGLAAAVAQAPDRADVRWAEGRLAHARGRKELAIARLREAWQTALKRRWPMADRALVARELADALSDAGDLDGALTVNDRALADLLSTVDEHLDRDDLGAGGLPRGAAGGPTDPVAMRALALLHQRGRVAADRASSLLQQGDRAAAMRILDAGVARISGTV